MPRRRLSLRSLALGCSLMLLALAAPAASARADGYSIEPLKEAPPAALADPVRGVLETQGYRLRDGEGKVYADLWLRKGVPASEAPAGPKGAILYPFLAVGELLGALRFPDEGHDNRDQSIAKGVYTLRYGLQPVNGDHLGISPHRDYALLVPAARDKDLALLAKKPLEEKSATSAGTSHPAILMLIPAGSGAKTPSVKHDTTKDTWGAIVPLTLAVKGGKSLVEQAIQIVVVGVFGS